MLGLGAQFHIIFTSIAHVTKFTRGSSLFMEKSLLMEKSKVEESPWKKNRPEEEKKGSLCQVKNKIILWKRLVLAELHAGFQNSNNEVAVQPKFAIHDVKKKVFFSLCKYQPWNKNIKNRVEFNFRCLAPQLILRFFHFCHGFFLCLWQLCSLLCRPPQRSKRSKLKKKVSAVGYFSRAILIHRHDARRFRGPIGLRFQEAR